MTFGSQSDSRVSEKGEKQIKEAEKDPVVQSIGALGKWQILICFMIFLVKFPISWHQMSIIFLAPPASFNCISTEKTNDIPITAYTSKCEKNCTKYEYDRSIFDETIVTQWNLVCDRVWLKDLTQTIFMFGILIGSFAFGQLSDKYGRRMPLLIAILLQAISGIATVVSVDWYMFTTLRFILAVATGGTMTTSFVLLMEVIGAQHREVIGVLYQIPFNTGVLIMAVIGYYIREWYYFQLAISIPSLFLLSYFFFLPESPRWLITAGRTDEAVDILIYAANRNGLTTDSIKESVEKASTDMSKSSTIRGNTLVYLFKTPKMRIKTFCVMFNWLSCGLCFFGVSQFVGQLAGNIFVNVAVSAFIQVPGTIFAAFTNKKFGRKVNIIIPNVIAGISCLLISASPNEPSIQVAFGCTGLFGICMSFATVYLYSGEVFPTMVRNTGLGLGSTVARIGSMCAPFIASLKGYHFWLPTIIFGIIPIIGAGLTLLLPETKGKKLPDTIEDSENF